MHVGEQCRGSLRAVLTSIAKLFRKFHLRLKSASPPLIADNWGVTLYKDPYVTLQAKELNGDEDTRCV